MEVVNSLMVCTCTAMNERSGHLGECALWYDDDFAEGMAEWDPDLQMLVLSVDLDSFMQEEPDDDVVIRTLRKTLGEDFDEKNDKEAFWLPQVYDYIGRDELTIIEYLIEGATSITEHELQQLELWSLDLHQNVTENELPLFDCFCYTRKKSICEDCGVRAVELEETKGDTVFVPTKARLEREVEMYLAAEHYSCSCPGTRVYCFKCGTQKMVKGKNIWTFHRYGTAYAQTDDYWGTGTGWHGGGTVTQKCRHYEQEVTLPNGLKIWGSSSHTRTATDPKPDFGIYMYDTWPNDVLAYKVNWADYGLPKIPVEGVLRAAEHGLAMARKGDIVEVGCMGGHGRTGSMMAIMCLLAGSPNAKHAIDWVHEKYCDHAIEGDKQEWFIAFVDALINNLPEVPRMPCSFSEHRAMFTKNETCDCKDWEEDRKTLQKEKDKPKTHTNTGPFGKPALGSVIDYGDFGSAVTDTSVLPSAGHDCSQRRHQILWWRGNDKCDRTDTDCKWWDKDVADMKEKPTQFSRRPTPHWTVKK